MTIIKSKQFILRPYKKGDEAPLAKNVNNKDVYRYTLAIPYPYNLKDAKEWIKHCMSLDKKTKKDEINFAIVIGGEVAGGIGLKGINGHKAEIGYWLGKDYWNKKIMTNAVKLVTNFGFNQLRLKRIYALVFSPNKASKKVLDKNEYKQEGIMRKYEDKDGKLMDTLIYAKVR